MERKLFIIFPVLLFCLSVANAQNLTVCVGRPDGYFANNHANCQAYWICQGGIGFAGECTPGYNFNEGDQNCDLPENFPCDDTPEPTQPPEPFNCPRNGIHLFGTEDSCTQYHLCFAGNHTLRECGNGLLFDSVHRQCDHPANVNCDQTLCPLVDNLEELVTIPSKSSCEEYYICYNGVAQPFRCADGIHWNQESQNCDLPEHANCQIPQPITCPDDGNLHFISHSQNVQKYYICIGQNVVQRSCPTTLIFDPTISECNVLAQTK